MNENKERLDLDELDQVTGGSGTSDLKIQCPYCSFTSPKTQKGLKDLKEHFRTSHADRSVNYYN